MKQKPTAVIVAGGEARRMDNRDKPLQKLAGKELLQHVIERIADSVDEIVISVNRNLEAYEKYGKPIISDVESIHSSPLLGIYSTMQWLLKHQPEQQWLVCIPADVPVFPTNVIELLMTAVAQSSTELAFIESAGQPQPLFSIWHVNLLDELTEELEKGNYGVRYFIERHQGIRVPVNAEHPADFVNLNSLAELAEMEALLAT